MNQIPRRKVKRRSNRLHRGNTLATVIITIISTLLVVFIAFLVVGNVLHNKGFGGDNQNDNTSNATENDEEENERIRPQSIQAHNVMLETAGVGTFKDRVAKLKNEGVQNVSVTLRNKNGELLYKSGIAPSLGIASSGNVSLTKAIESVNDANVYYSGIYYVTAFSIDDRKQRSVELARSAAIISEILDAGVNDVVIIAPELTSEHIDEAIAFYNDIKTLSDNGFIGITLTDEILASENAAHTLDKLYGTFDFLSVNAIEEETTPETLNEKISKVDSIYLYMYNIRIILPALSDADASSALVTEAEKIGLKNLQYIA